VSGSAFVLIGTHVRLDRGGLSGPAPGSAEGLLRLCTAWAAEVGWSLATSPGAADGVVVGPGITPPPLEVPVVPVRPGQGIDGFRWALRHLAFTAVSPPEPLAYGDGPDHAGDLRRPAGAGPHPLALLLHGGFWMDAWRRDLMDGIAIDLAQRGWVTWNVEYRRVGAGGGWPATANDVRAAVDAAARIDGVTNELLLVGHSAGGQLALWAAGERPERVSRVVSLAGLCDLDTAARHGVGGDAVHRFLEGEPASSASPIDRLPLRVPVIAAHAVDDSVVPVDQTRRYAEAATQAGDTVELIEVPTGGHMTLIEPDGGWSAVAPRFSVDR
jgi:acetyl esterase/lipase